MTDKVILPPAMLGILGGGQLGRMFAIAAKTMGYRVMVLDPQQNAPAAEFADVHLCAAYDDKKALKQLATCAAVTTEFENIDADAMRQLAKSTRVSPSGDSVAIAQNRILEKTWITKAGLQTAPFQAIKQLADINENSQQYLPGVLKTATLGYDGKGQVRVYNLDELKQGFASLNGVTCVLEKYLDLRSEISVIVCRLDNDNIKTFPVAQNEHINGILAYSTVPAPLADELLERAQEKACRLANELQYVGVLAVELFVVGDEQQLIVNEIAPRPHNSGHYTLDACLSDQFQQQVRLMCALPPADTDLLSACCMANILGGLWAGNSIPPHWQYVLANGRAHLHLYGKHEARKGRKMGHFTVLDADAGQARQIAEDIHKQLNNWN